MARWVLRAPTGPQHMERGLPMRSYYAPARRRLSNVALRAAILLFTLSLAFAAGVVVTR